MTQPVQEQLTQRSIGYGKWRTNQLERRPAPHGAETIPWVILHDGATNVLDDTEMPIPFGEINWDVDLVTKDGDHFDWVITDDGDPGNDRIELILKKRGWYDWQMRTQWDETTSPSSNNLGYAVQFLNIDPNSGFFVGAFPIKNSADWMSTAFEEGLFEMLENQFLDGAGTFFKTTDADRRLKPTAKQLTGVNRGLEGLFLIVRYLGGLGGTIDSADWGSESV